MRPMLNMTRRNGSSRTRDRLGGERGMVIVVVMMFCVIFLVLGLALYWISSSQIKGTETERRDVSSFNVAEAGVDSGMLALKLDWPRNEPATEADRVSVNEDIIKIALQDANAKLTDSSSGEFLQVSIYDNSKGNETDGYETEEPPDESTDPVYWDANGDDRMYVDATSHVDNNVHRILLLAERQPWLLPIPVEFAVRSSDVIGNPDLSIGIDERDAGTGELALPPDGNALYYVDPPAIDEIDLPADYINDIDYYTGGEAEFDEMISESLLEIIKNIAIQQGTYFNGAYADDDASDYLLSGAANGKVIYVDAEDEVKVGGGQTEPLGTVDEPILVIIDTPEGSNNIWELDGSAQFYGMVICLGNSTLSGGCSTHGAMLVEGDLRSNGTAGIEIMYNYDVINNLRNQYTTSVNIVANTWEEYTGGE